MNFKKIKSYLPKNLTMKYPFIFTACFIAISMQYPLRSLEYSIYDILVQTDVFAKQKGEAVVVYMDEESDAFLGESYPYSYASQFRAFEKLKKDDPLHITYLYSLPSPVDEVDKLYAEKFLEDVEVFQEKKILRQSIEFDRSGEKRENKIFDSISRDLSVVTFDSSSYARDDVVRRVILNVSGDDSMYLKIANDIRANQHLEPLGIQTVPGSYYRTDADATFAMIRLPENPTNIENLKMISFYKLLTGNFPKGYFSGKSVFFGSKYQSNSSDYILTSYNKDAYDAPKIVYQAMSIMSLAAASTVFPVRDVFSNIVVIMIAIFLSVVVSRIRPGKGLIITLLSALGVLVLSWVFFSVFGYWIKIAHMLFSILVVYYIWIPFRAIDEYQQKFAIQEETKLLKKVEGLKKNFISLMSHDLKTPVAKIAGIADMMARNNQSDVIINKNLGQIKDATKELNGFITSILDLSKVESSNLVISKISKDINVILEDVVGKLRFEAKQGAIQIDTELSPLYPIEIDVKLITRVFSNLIENAIKYSGSDSVIKIKTWDDNEWVYISIKDNGVGICASDLDHLFDKFYRVKNDANHQIKGSGLGLYLVKYFVELHGGTITVESEVGDGTLFTVKLLNC